MNFPRMAPIEQHFPSNALADPVGSTEQELENAELKNRYRPRRPYRRGRR